MGDATIQEYIDRYHHEHGPCCGGCDHWRWISSKVGDCMKSAPVSGRERADMLGIAKLSLAIPAGHVLTLREHHCGDFRDTFDWGSLPLGYLARVRPRAALEGKA